MKGGGNQMYILIDPQFKMRRTKYHIPILQYYSLHTIITFVKGELYTRQYPSCIIKYFNLKTIHEKLKFQPKKGLVCWLSKIFFDTMRW